MGSVIYTIGYGGRTLVEFIELLRGHGIQVLIDIRRWNKSVRNPIYSGENLEKTLSDIGISYYWFTELGGYRRFGVDVDDYGVASCFESEGFRAYATYITRRNDVTPVLERLVDIATRYTSAVMCSERIPWRCHRKILSDYLVVKGFRVYHIIDREQLIEHRLSRCAIVEDGYLRYV